MPDIVDRLIEAAIGARMYDDYAYYEAERYRLAALLRERLAASDEAVVVLGSLLGLGEFQTAKQVYDDWARAKAACEEE